MVIPPYIGYIGYMVDGPWQGFDGFGGDVETLTILCMEVCMEVRLKV